MQKKKIFKKGPSTVLKLEGNEKEGTIVAHFGSIVEVGTLSGEKVRCHLRKNFEPVITGDRVLWRPLDQMGVIVRLLPRHTLLARPEHRKNKLIAANIDWIIIVTAPPPTLSLRLLDRYLVAAEHLKIKPVLLLNKIDLLDATQFAKIKTGLAHYQKIGYPVIFSSTVLENGLKELGLLLKNKSSVLVGASGVGKSSIIQKITGAPDVIIGESPAGQQAHGQHTTTTTRLYPIHEGGNVIDSPGVREFALWHLEKDDVFQAFIDFQPFIGSCQFRNCQHEQEPGCALQQAVSAGEIHRERWESYWDIVGEGRDAFSSQK